MRGVGTKKGFQSGLTCLGHEENLPLMGQVAIPNETMANSCALIMILISQALTAPPDSADCRCCCSGLQKVSSQIFSYEYSKQHLCFWASFRDPR